MKRERIISTEELDLPDDPETTRTATLVVIFCIIGGPTILTMIMLIAIHAEAIDNFFKEVVVFLYWHQAVTFTLFLYAIAFSISMIIKRLK